MEGFDLLVGDGGVVDLEVFEVGEAGEGGEVGDGGKPQSSSSVRLERLSERGEIGHFGVGEVQSFEIGKGSGGRGRRWVFR